MLARVQEYWQICHAFCVTHPFLTGFAAGFICFVLVLILLALLRPKRLSSLTIDVGNGEISISSNSICDLVQSLERVIDCIRIRRVTLLQKHSRKWMKIDLDFMPTGVQNVPEVVRSLQEKVREVLSNCLGITEIQEIKVCVQKCPVSSADFLAGPAKKDEPALPQA